MEDDDSYMEMRNNVINMSTVFNVWVIGKFKDVYGILRRIPVPKLLQGSIISRSLIGIMSMKDVLIN